VHSEKTGSTFSVKAKVVRTKQVLK